MCCVLAAMDYILIMATDAARDRLDALRDKLQDQLDALKERQTKGEKKMLEMAGTWGKWQAESLGRDKQQAAAIARVEESTELTTGSIQALGKSTLDGFKVITEDNRTAFKAIQVSLGGLVQDRETRERVEAALAEERKTHGSQPLLASVLAAPVVAPAPGAAPAPAPASDSTSLQTARGYVDLLKSIPPFWVALLLVGGIGSSITLTVFFIFQWAS